MKRSRCSTKPVYLVLFALLSVTVRSRAQSSDPQALATAQTLYDRAVKAMDKKDYASACPALEEVARLVPDGLGGKLTLAECYEASGRLASAWTMYVLVDSAAVKPSQAKHRAAAHKKAEVLKPKLAQITIVVPESVRGLPALELTRDGVPVGGAQWGVPLPVNKGEHVIVVTAAGKQRVERTVEIEADGGTVTVDIGGMVDGVPALPTVEVKPGPTEALIPPAVVLVERRARQRTAAVVIGGGAIAFGIGVSFGIQAIVKKNQSNAPGGCIDVDYCPEPAANLRVAGRIAGDRSTALLAGGTAMLAAGVALLLTAPRLPDGDTKVSVGPHGFEVTGTW